MKTVSPRAKAWHNAGLVTDELLVDRPLPMLGLWLPAQIKLDGPTDRLLWCWHAGKRGDRLIPVPKDLLTRFVRLGETTAGASAEPSGPEVLAFAQAFGPLDCWEIAEEWETFRSALPRGWDFGEPLEHWRYYTAAVRAVIEITARLKTKTDLPGSLWRLLARPPRAGDAPLFLQSIINKWLAVGEVAPLFLWDPTADLEPEAEPRIVTGAGSLFGQLAIQLARAVAGARGWAICKNCQQEFWIPDGTRGRRPRYCARETCGERARWRLASARRYQAHPKGKNGGSP